jgi:RNA-directed DNA polymerase
VTWRLKSAEGIRELTKRNQGSSLERVISELRSYLLGWRGYFGCCLTPSMLHDFDS